MTTMITSSSSSSLVSLPRLVATSRMRHGPARPLGRPSFCGRGRACRSHLWRLVVVRGVVVVAVLAGRSQPSVWRQFVGRWPSVTGRCPFCARLSRCWGVWAAVVVCGGVSRVTWHAGDMHGARFVVDVGGMGVWLSCLVLRRLSWFVGSRGCSWWWGSLVAPWW